MSTDISSVQTSDITRGFINAKKSRNSGSAARADVAICSDETSVKSVVSGFQTQAPGPSDSYSAAANLLGPAASFDAC